MTKSERLESGIANIKEQFDESGDSPWLEGWICGYTDSDNGLDDNDAIHDDLLDYLRELRNKI